MKLCFLAGLLSLTTVAMAALPAPTFLGDNNTSLSMLDSASDFAEMSGYVYFSAAGAFGEELHRTDGTSNEAELVKDINIGKGSAITFGRLTVFENNLYFFANDGIHGSEVWKSDGTSSGTTMLLDVNAGYGSSSSNILSDPYMRFIAGKDYLYFVAGASSPRKLYRTDGTTEGTVPVGTTSIPDGNDIFCTAGDLTYFLASTPTAGIELWRTDGTDAGTFMVKDINAGARDGFIRNMTAYNNELYFTAQASGGGTRLYKTNGTSAGTVMLSSVSVHDSAGIAISGGKIYFSNNSVLYTNNGTAGNSVLVKAINSSNGVYLDFISPTDNGIVFVGRDEAGSGLWKSDGTAAGTVKLKTYTSNIGRGASLSAGSHVYFYWDAGSNKELLVTDGTESGTRYITGVSMENVGLLTGFELINGDLYFALYDGSPYTSAFRVAAGSNIAMPLLSNNKGSAASFSSSGFTQLGDSVVFSGWNSETGSEPWISNGTPDGTHILADLVPGPGSSEPTLFSVIGDKVVFTVSKSSLSYGLAVTDGTSSGTQFIMEEKWQYVGLNNVSTGDAVYFIANETIGAFSPSSIWRTDGTLIGTVRLDQPEGLSFFPRLQKLGNMALFTGITNASGRELWKADATSTSVSMVKDIWPGSGSSLGTYLSGLEFNGYYYFLSNHPDFGRELWKTDGTEAGTQMVVDAEPGTGGAIAAVYGARDNKFYFVTNTGTGKDLWETDGTSAGTVKVLSASSSAFSMGLAKLGSKLVFSSGDSTTGIEPWVYDYDTSTATLLKDVFPGESSSDADHLVTVGSHAYFIADDGVEGKELWITDGTPEGTLRTGIIRPGKEDPMIRERKLVGDKLVFSANDGIHGQELWVADSAAGILTMVSETEPGAGSSTPYDFTELGDQLIYSAYSSESGLDLWSLPMENDSAVDDWTIY